MTSNPEKPNSYTNIFINGIILCKLNIIKYSILKQINNLVSIFDFVSKDMGDKIRKMINALNTFKEFIRFQLGLREKKYLP